MIRRPDIELLYIRHGETVWNRQRRMQGHKDSPLTLTGWQQAQRVALLLDRRFGGELAHFRWQASPLGRAWQTAVVIAETLGLDPARIDHDLRLREMTWGDWDGLTAAEIEARDPELWQARIDDRWTVAPPGGGETQADIVQRAAAWLAALAPGSRTVAVAHGALGRAVRTAYLGLEPAAMLTLDEPHDAIFWFNHGEIVRLEPEKKGKG
ncbi:MAG: histidine phosphatase family protein [Geminicoccaceae bacterium]|nr:MAG: histidine phosphatase family protein [Geminicoccaceae bacterium]